MNAPNLSDFKPKSFWSRPEGTSGMLFGAAAIVTGLYGLYNILPWVITLLQNTLYTIFLSLAVGAVIYVIADSRFRNLLSFAYKSVMRAITGVFITIDPIGIIKNYVDTLKKNLQNIQKQQSNVRGQIELIKREMQANAGKMNQNIRIVQQAKKDDKYAMEAKLAARSTGRLEQTNVTYQQLMTKMEGLYRVLCKTEEAANFLIMDISEEITVKEKERKVILAGHSAIRSAMKIIKPEDDKKAMFDMTMEYLAEDVASKVGDIEHFMDISQSFLNSVDLQNGIFEQEGWEILENWEKKDSALLGKEKQVLLEQARDPNQELDFNNPINKEKIPRENQFGHLLN